MPPFNITTNSTITPITLFAKNSEMVVTTKDPDDFSSEELAKQKLFSTLVIACFFSFLVIVITYVSFTHIKRNLNRIRQEKKDDSDDGGDKPRINRRTSVMGQGQKQVVIERKASVMSNSRRQSMFGVLGNGNQQSGPQLNTKLLRQPPWMNAACAHMQTTLPNPPMMGGVVAPNVGCGLSGRDGIPKKMSTLNIPPTVTQSRAQNNFSYPNSYPMNTYLENVLIRYHGNSFTEEREKSTTEENESGVSSSESIIENEKKESKESTVEENNPMLKRMSGNIDEEDEDENDAAFEISPSLSFVTEESHLLTP